MKIVHVLNHFLPHQTAGTEVYVWALCKQLQKSNHQITVVIPNYETDKIDTYEYDGIKVYRYAEPSIPVEFITGVKTSEGVKNFTAYLRENMPEIVHFHEVAGSTGVGVAHFEAAKMLGCKVVFTIHLATNTCATGSLMFKETKICDGEIKLGRCSYCMIHKRTNNSFLSSILTALSVPLKIAGINTLNWNNSIGTSLGYPQLIQRIKNNLERINNATDIIIPITNWYYQILLKNGIPASKMNVILQAIPLEIPVVTEKKIAPNLPLRLVFVGRIHQLKGIPLLIETIKEFPKNEIQLDIYGLPNKEEFLTECKNATADHPNIVWKGKLAQTEVTNTLKNYHALVLPSLFSEMSPLVIQEAFEAGIPVIGSNVYGIAEQVREGKTGWLFEMGNKASFKNCLQQVISNIANIETIYNNINKPRSFDKVGKETLIVYESLLNK